MQKLTFPGCITRKSVIDGIKSQVQRQVSRDETCPRYLSLDFFRLFPVLIDYVRKYVGLTFF